MWIKTTTGFANLSLASEILQPYEFRPEFWQICFNDECAKIHPDDLEKVLNFIEKNRL